MSTVKNYSKRSEFHATWTSVDEFCAAEIHQDGAHTVQLGDLQVELLLAGDPLASEQKRIPVFFNGAIMGREEAEPPFFSGGGVARQADSPIICISDPTVDSNDAINIAWYAGRRGEALQSQLTELFTKLADTFGKELMFMGASAGGFAAIYYAAQLGDKASVFAWNPQTDITYYVPMFSQRYLKEAGVSDEALAGSDWRERAKAELAGQIELTLPPSAELTKTKKALILQNRTDWHLEKHMLPWLDQSIWQEQKADGLDAYAADDNHMVAIVDYAEGHDPIPPMIISFLMADMLHTESPVKDFLNGSDDV